MLSVVFVGCAIMATIALVHYLLQKSRFAESDIERTIAKKLVTSSVMIELNRLREDNAVMRNLLIDLLENETSSAARLAAALPSEQRHLGGVRLQRYREILAEAAYLVRHSGNLNKTPKGEYSKP